MRGGGTAAPGTAGAGRGGAGGGGADTSGATGVPGGLGSTSAPAGR